jgi:chloramphenicol-sensitive protein RarD
MNINKHYAAAITAFLIWGFFAIPLKALAGYSSGQILYFRIVLSVTVLALLIAGFRRNQLTNNIALFKSFSTTQRNWVIGLTLVGGVLLTVNWLTFIYIVNNINVKTASFSYLICPVLTAALGTLLLKEQLTKLQWLAVFLCTMSCALIGMSSMLELGFSFLTALTYALYLISQRKNQGFDRIIVLGIQVLFALIILSFFFKTLVPSVPQEFSFYGIVAIIAVFFTVLPLFLNLFALNKINSATIGILMYINPIINFSVALLVYGEKMDWLQVVGYSIIFIALILFNYTTLTRTLARN